MSQVEQVDFASLAKAAPATVGDAAGGIGMPGLPAASDAGNAAPSGPGAVAVAEEVKRVGDRITDISAQLSGRLAASMAELRAFGDQIVQQMQGERLSDLAHTILETTDRSIHERSCDLRWWAADAPIVTALTGSAAAVAPAQARLAALLGAYKSCLDLWIADAQGRIVASGRAGHSGGVAGADVSADRWFREAIAGSSGEDYAVGDVMHEPRLGGAPVVTLATAIHDGGKPDSRPLGTLALHLDWKPHAAAVLAGLRLTAAESSRTRCLILDAGGRIIAASDGGAVLAGSIHVGRFADCCGHYVDDSGCRVAFARSAGHETYHGLGWYGVIVQAPPAG